MSPFQTICHTRVCAREWWILDIRAYYLHISLGRPPLPSLLCPTTRSFPPPLLLHSLPSLVLKLIYTLAMLYILLPLLLPLPFPSSCFLSLELILPGKVLAHLRRSLFIQYPVTTMRAANVILFLQCHVGSAISTDVHGMDL